MTCDMHQLCCGSGVALVPTSRSGHSGDLPPRQNHGAATAYCLPQRAVAAAIISMTSNIMILPLPVNQKAAKRQGTRDPGHSLRMWGMVPGTPLADLHLHFSDAVHNYIIRQSRIHRTVQNLAVHL